MAIGRLNIPLLAWMCRVVAYPYCIIVGFIFGSYYGLQSGVYASIIPGGQEAEYTAVGMCVCSGNLFVYLGADVVGYVLAMVVEDGIVQSFVSLLLTGYNDLQMPRWFGVLLRWVPGIIYGVMVDFSPAQSHRWAFMHLGGYMHADSLPGMNVLHSADVLFDTFSRRCLSADRCHSHHLH